MDKITIENPTFISLSLLKDSKVLDWPRKSLFHRFRCLLIEKKVDDPSHLLLSKEGKSRIVRKGLEKHRQSFIKDIYNTILEMRWRWALLIFLTCHASTFFIFAVFWWLFSYIHEDLNLHEPDFQPCIPGLETFSDYFLFSLETQTTIGYGFVYPNADCVTTIPTLFFQVVIGFLIEIVTLGFVFAKLARPKNRSNTIMFSKTACVCQENNQIVLQVRVADLRHTHLIDAQVRGMLVTEYVTQEGIVYPLYQTKIDFEINNAGSRVFLMWPVVLSHRITETSPFFHLMPEDLFAKDMELFIWIDGIIESTGEMCQVKTSYIAEEIVYGYRFCQIEKFNEEKGRWQIDFKHFENIAPCPLSYYGIDEVTPLDADCDSCIMTAVSPLTHGTDQSDHTEPKTVI